MVDVQVVERDVDEGALQKSVRRLRPGVGTQVVAEEELVPLVQAALFPDMTWIDEPFDQPVELITERCADRGERQRPPIVVVEDSEWPPPPVSTAPFSMVDSPLANAVRPRSSLSPLRSAQLWSGDTGDALRRCHPSTLGHLNVGVPRPPAVGHGILLGVRRIDEQGHRRRSRHAEFHERGLGRCRVGAFPGAGVVPLHRRPHVLTEPLPASKASANRRRSEERYACTSGPRREGQIVAVAVHVILRGVSPEHYEAVRDETGWVEQPPAGGYSHVAWWEADDNHTVDSWDGEEAFQAFGENRLGPATAKLGTIVAPEVTFHPAHEVFTPQSVRQPVEQTEWQNSYTADPAGGRP